MNDRKNALTVLVSSLIGIYAVEPSIREMRQFKMVRQIGPFGMDNTHMLNRRSRVKFFQGQLFKFSFVNTVSVLFNKKYRRYV
jgi:hypothetical protein